MPQREQIFIRDELVHLLLDRVRSDPYPSVDMLNSIEALLGPEELGEYAEILLEHVRNDRYPSWSMIERLHKLAGRQIYAALATRR